jgi:hypothetical protein
MRHTDVSLDDKYELEQGRAFVTGVQALLRVMLDQHRLDMAAGLNTAGFVSGYRGSPSAASTSRRAAPRSGSTPRAWCSRKG